MTTFNVNPGGSSCLTEKQLFDYVHHRMTREATREAEEHLSDCPLCSDAVDGLMQEPEVESNAAVEAIRKATEQLIYATKKEEAIVTSFSTSSRIYWMTAAAILLLLGSGWFFYYQGKQTSTALAQHQTDSLPQPPSSSTVTPSEHSLASDPPQTEKAIPVYKQTDTRTKPVLPANHIREEDRSKDVTDAEPAVQPATELIPHPDQVNEKSGMPRQQRQTDVATHEDVKKDAPIRAVPSAGGFSNYNAAPALRNSYTLSYPKNAKEETALLNNTRLDNEWELGFEAYGKQNYRLSAMLLEKALKKSEGALKDSIRYYLALDYLETAKRAQAMELFEELAAGSLFQEQATQKLSRMSR